MKKFKVLVLFLIVVNGFVGCASFTGGQPIVWSKAEEIDFSKTAMVEISATVAVPEKEIEFMKNDIQSKLDQMFTGKKNSKGNYVLKVIITKYDEGNACARFMLAGLGQMHLYGDVEVSKGNPPVLVRKGEFKKNYRLGGIVGGTAKMNKDMTAKVGSTIADALKTDKTGEK